MEHPPILPPSQPPSAEEDASLYNLVALARSGAPPAGTSDDDEIVQLPSWRSESPSAFPQVWSAPPRAEGRGRVAVAFAFVALVVVSVGATGVAHWSRTRDAVAPRVAAVAAPIASSPAMPLAAPDTVSGPVAAVDDAVALVDAVAAVDSAPVAESPVVGDAARVEPRASADEPEAAEVDAETSAEPATASPETEPAAEAVPTADPDAVALTAQVVETEPEPVATPEPARPEVPTRDAVVAAMDGVRTSVRACAARHGSASVWITVRPDGRVASALVTGVLAGTPEGSCIARAVRGARFPAFTRESFEVSYPFAF